MTNRILLVVGICVVGFTLHGCDLSETSADGYGTFEATEVLVSSQSQGPVTVTEVREGESVTKGQILARIDPIAQKLAHRRAVAARDAITARIAAAKAEAELAAAQLHKAERDLARARRLVAVEAASRESAESLETGATVASRRLQAADVNVQALKSELRAQDANVAAALDQIHRTRIFSPLTGIVLSRYVEPGEVVGYGQPLFAVAEMHQMRLKVYLPEPQLPELRLGQSATVRYDTRAGLAEVAGEVVWISSEAEFTPKYIQTPEERVNLVYAVDLMVQNSGDIKIGMPGEVKF